ncbi:hypothetical protein M0805_003220 [Coniferiporia weirii]|nr:hypothetical protein M0805_003220 [Coniferiporia weirii]
MSDKVLAQAPGDDCFKAVQHSGDPKGTILKIAGVDTYVSTPPQNVKGQPAKGVILFYADVYGPMFINNKLIQDFFAEQGFIVVGIDYFLGDPVYIHDGENGFDRSAWLEKSKIQARKCEPDWLKAIQEKYGQEISYAAVGYCFGAPFVCEAAAAGKLIAGAIAHPAFLDESHFRNLNAPLLLSCAEIDHTFPLEFRRRAEDILIENKNNYHFQVFADVKHGFAVRGDPKIENERWAKEESAKSIVGWFERFTK